MKLSNDTHLPAPSTGNFEFINLDGEGSPVGRSIRINTLTGLVLQCHPRCDHAHIRHMADIARETPDYPVDISYWSGPEGARMLKWWARIYWRGPKVGGR